MSQDYPAYVHPKIGPIRLGKKPAKVDPRIPRLAKYTVGLPAPPPSVNWYGGQTQWGMMGNDVLGDCVPAATGHAVQVASLNTTEGEIVVPDQTVLKIYEWACGYVPGDPATDQGGVITSVLNFLTGAANANALGREHKHRHKMKLIAYAGVDPSDLTHIQQGIYTFGMVDVGLQLPLSAQAQVGGVWDVVGDPKTDPNSRPGSWGGHSVIISAYDSTGMTCITWGQLQRMTWKFWLTYGDECYATLFRQWMKRFAGQYPAMLAQLEQDLKEVAG